MIDQHTSSHRGPSTDRGYAWVVLASCFSLRMMVDCFWPCLGLLFLQWQRHFDVSATTTAWFGSTFMLILLSSAPVASALARLITYRAAVIGAGIATSLCLYGISMSTDFWQIYMFMPILGMGLGVALQTGCAFFVVYFDKRLALATGLISASTAAGLLTLPPLIEIMFRYYGWRGSLQITSAMMANICVCGALLKSPRLGGSRNKSKMLSSRNGSSEPQTDTTMEETRCSFFKDIAKCFDMSLFRNLRFIFQGVGNGLLYGGNNTAIMYFIPHAISVGIPTLESSYIMLSFGISSFITRLSPIGLIVDNKIISASALGGVAFFACGLNIIATSFTTSYAGFLTVAIIYGVTIGIGAFLRPVVLTHAVGSRDRALGAIAWMLLHEGVGTLVCTLLMGFLFDVTGSYQTPLIISGICLMCLGINMLADPCFVRCQNPLRNRERRGDADHSANFSEQPKYTHV